MAKEWYGALMGLGEGISGYGKALTTNALAEQADERISARQSASDARTSIRQKSLEEIRQEFQLGQTERREQFELNKIEDQRNYDMQKLDPDTEIGGQVEAAKQRELERQIELRKTPYGNQSNSGLLSKIDPRDYTPESFQPFMAKINELVDQGMTPDEALRVTSGEMSLVRAPKDQSTGSMDASVVNDVNTALAEAKDADKKYLVRELVGIGVGSPEDLEKKSKDELLNLYKSWLYQFYSPNQQTPQIPTQNGLMNGASSPSQPDPLGLRQ